MLNTRMARSRSSDRGNPTYSALRRIVQITAPEKSSKKALFVGVTSEGNHKPSNWLVALPNPTDYDPMSEDAPIVRAEAALDPLSTVTSIVPTSKRDLFPIEISLTGLMMKPSSSSCVGYRREF